MPVIHVEPTHWPQKSHLSQSSLRLTWCLSAFRVWSRQHFLTHFQHMFCMCWRHRIKPTPQRSHLSHIHLQAWVLPPCFRRSPAPTARTAGARIRHLSGVWLHHTSQCVNHPWRHSSGTGQKSRSVGILLIFLAEAPEKASLGSCLLGVSGG